MKRQNQRGAGMAATLRVRVLAGFDQRPWNDICEIRR
jgi:hypothetical protein